MPFQLKAFNILLGFTLTYIFTNTFYSLGLSITFAVITSILLYIYGGIFFAMIFFIMFGIILTKKINEKNKSLGIIIKQTNINETPDKKAFMCDKQQNENNIISYGNFRNEVDNRDFSLCVYLYINGSNPAYKNKFSNYRFRDWKSIFYLGSSDIKESAGEGVNEIKDLYQVPGLWLKPSLNNIVLVINDGQNNDRLELDNVPLNEWFSISIIMNSASISLYKNCKLEKIIGLKNIIPDTTKYNLYIANDGKAIKYSDDVERNGFPGQMAYFTYYNFILTQNQINEYCNRYRNVLNKYQYKQNEDVKYETSCLVTDSDTNTL